MGISLLFSGKVRLFFFKANFLSFYLCRNSVNAMGRRLMKEANAMKMNKIKIFFSPIEGITI
jgi:hypothetical protein